MTIAQQDPEPRPQARDLLRAVIAAGDRNRFSVALRPGAERGTNAVFVRFALHYYARALFELSPDPYQVKPLVKAVEALSQVAMEDDSDLFAIAGMRGRLVDQIDDPLAEARVALRSPSYRTFEVAGDIGSLRGEILAGSAIAVIQAILSHLSRETLATMAPALANMNASYTVTHRYGDPESQHEVPAIAFMAASFV